MQLVSVLAAEQQLRNDPGFDHFRRAPFGRDHDALTEVPPEVVSQLLRPAILLPCALYRKVVMVEHEHATRSVAVRRANRVDVDAVRSTVDGVRPTVASFTPDFVRVDDFDEFGLSRVGLGVQHVNARGAQSRYE